MCAMERVKICSPRARARWVWWADGAALARKPHGERRLAHRPIYLGLAGPCGKVIFRNRLMDKKGGESLPLS